MSHDLGHKKCRMKVFVMFCYVDGKNGLLFRFADMEPSLGNFSKLEAYSSSQIYNQCSTSTGENYPVHFQLFLQ